MQLILSKKEKRIDKKEKINYKKCNKRLLKSYLLSERGEEMDDEKILALFDSRSGDAIAETDARYGAICRSIAGKLLQNKADMEECVNDAYHALWNAIPPARPSSLGAYIA